MKKLLFFMSLGLIQPVFAAPYFWSFQKDGKTVHLLGTAHQGVAIEDLTCPDNSNKVRESLLNSDLVFLETLSHPDDTPLKGLSIKDIEILLIGSQQEKQQLYKDRLISQERRTLIENYLEKQKIKKIQAYEQNNGHKFVDNNKESTELLSQDVKDFLLAHGIELEDDFSNIFYSLLISSSYITISLSDKKMDQEIQKIARETGISLSTLDEKIETGIPLSTLDEKLKPLIDELDLTNMIPLIKLKEIEINALDIEQSILDLKKSLEQEQQLSNYLNTLYLQGKVPTLASMYQATSTPLDEHTIDNLLLNRNALWVDKILTALENPEYQNIFVAAGAQHFIGEDNVLDILMKKGLTIKQETCSGSINLVSKIDPVLKQSFQYYFKKDSSNVKKLSPLSTK